MKEPAKLYMIIPCYNEEEVLPMTAKVLRGKYGSMIESGLISPESRIVFVNDGSKDATREIIAKNCFNGANLPINTGLTSAFRTGMKYAWRHGYGAVVQFDADGQHSAAYIDDMVEVAEETGANVGAPASTAASATACKGAGED